MFIACETQAQFESLCALMGQPELLLDPRFATNEARVANQDELDAIVGDWTRPRRRYDIMRRCQAAAIIAAVVQSAEDRVEYDPQLQHREMHPVIEHPKIGDVPVRRLSGEDVAHARVPQGPRAVNARAQPLRLRRAAGAERRTHCRPGGRAGHLT